MDHWRRKGFLLIVGCIALAIISQAIGPRLREHEGWPNWNGIKPGITRPWNVQGLVGEVSYLELCPFNYTREHPFDITQKQTSDWLTCFRLPLAFVYRISEDAVYEADVVTNLTTVRYVAEDVIDVEPGLMLSDFLAEHGPPDRIEWSRRSSLDRVLVYCEKGLATHAAYRQITILVYFPPRSVSSCSSIQDLSVEMASENPFPNPERPKPEELDIWFEDWSREVIENMQ